LIITALGHSAELLIPATTRAGDRPDEEMTALDNNLDFIAKFDLINKCFWYTNPARVTDFYDLRFHRIHVYDSIK
jgi:hypothetical protein